MAELINTPTTLVCLFSRYAPGKETGTTNFIRTFYFNGAPCNNVALVFICIVLFFYVGFMIVIFMFCPEEKTHQMKKKKLFTDVGSLHVNV